MNEPMSAGLPLLRASGYALVRSRMRAHQKESMVHQ